MTILDGGIMSAESQPPEHAAPNGSQPFAYGIDRLGGLLRAATFLTRVPAPVPRAAARAPLADSAWAFPIIGGAVGLVGAVVLWLAREGLGVAVPVAALLAIAAQLLLTGALHEDGLADVADGFGGGATAERKLAIMRDSRIGTYGVVALVIGLGVRWMAVATVPPAERVVDLVVAGVLSRAVIPLLMKALPTARGDGAGVEAGTPDGVTVGVALALAALSLFWLSPWAVVPVVVMAACVSVAVGALARYHIGGYTGDVLGALAAAVESAVLVVLSGHP